ncbi:MAG: hypothetical protein WC544_03640 [Patescibacteria group bacterium]
MAKGIKKFNKKQRWVLLGALVFFAVQLVLPAAFAPRQVRAILGAGDTSVTIGDIPRTITEKIATVLKKAADVAFKNILKNYLNNLAYNTATKIVTGKPGQKPLWPENPEKYLKDAADAAAGDLLDSIASSQLGKSTCAGYSYQKCATNSDCPPVEMKCPVAVANQDCTSSIEAKNKCISLGCTPYSCNDGESCPPDSSDTDKDLIAGKAYLMQGAPECVASFSLCTPLDKTLGVSLPLKVQLQVLARKDVTGQTAPLYTSTCPLSSIINNFESATTDWDPNLTSTEKSKLYLAEISKTFNPQSSQLGIYFSIVNETEKTAAAAAKAAEFAKTITGPFDSIINPISKTVKTPGPLVEKIASDLPVEALKPLYIQTGTRIADAIGTFTNTLASKLIEKYLTKGLAPSNAGTKKTVGSGPRGVDIFGTSSGITTAKIQFADLKQTDYVVGGEQDVLSSISSCPDSKDPTPDTCVIDSRFSTAIEQKMTVQEALDAGLLDGSKIFGYNASGVEPLYYDGYPYRSLVILRKYRVIPVGWELAADYIRKLNGGNYTLNSIIKEYANVDSPFYHLVDPNWVLKLPAVTCNRAGAGEKIDSQETVQQVDTNNDGFIDNNDAAGTIIQRQSDYCADEQSCIAENDDGSCKKWGYCVEEKPIYKFSGTACDQNSASCMALSTASGQSVAYLMDTVDTNGCTADNAGCQNYCRDWDATTNRWTCTTLPPPQGGDQINLNHNAGTCQATGEGCTELMSVANHGTNLLLNSNFEIFETTGAGNFDGAKDGPPYNPDLFSNWTSGLEEGGVLCGDHMIAVSDTFDGRTASRIRAYADCLATPLHGHWTIADTVDAGKPTNGQSYTLSFYAKQATDSVNCNPTSGQVNISLGRAIVINGANVLQNPDDPNGTWDYTSSATITASQNWVRYVYTGTFTLIPDDQWVSFGGPGTPAMKNLLTPVLSRPAGDACDVIIDDIQLEIGSLTGYKAYESSPKTYLKMPPAYLNCTGNAATDDAACADYALVCKPSEVGCEAYTSTTTSRVVTGTITSPSSCDPNNPASCNQCPAEFVGCQAYRELPITSMPNRPTRDPVSFIASTGLSCPATAVGCEEYTNLETLQQGGEGKEYYSHISLCVDPNAANIRTYYTWEGSDEFGYQLKKYDLKQSNIDNAPCTNVLPQKTDGEYDPDGAGPLAPDATLNWANCVDNRTADVNGDTVIDSSENFTASSCVNVADICQAGLCTISGVSCSTNRDCIDHQLKKNLDCREFFDAQGNIYYRGKSKVIFSSDQCKAYRNSNDGANILYHMVPNQGVSCEANNVGCRAYKGNAGDNIRNIYSTDFENGGVSPWVGNGIYSNEATNVGGHSMLVANSAAYPNVAQSIGMAEDRSYTISFFAKAAATDTPVGAALTTVPGLAFSGQAVARAGDWNEYTLGPLYIPPGTDLTSVQLQLYSTNAFYVDNIVVTEIYQNIYLIKDSYTMCSGYEGCDLYKDRSLNTHYLKSFTSLCGPDKVGCEAMIDTKNSTTPDQLTYPITSTVNGTVPADSVVTVVNDPKKSCAATEKGCERMGKPSLDSDGNIENFSDMYLLNNPDKYDSTVCLNTEVGCQAYTSATGSQYFFKDPGANTCEYKKVTGQTVAGWYKTGTKAGLPDCPMTSGFCSSGDDYGKLCTSDADCANILPGQGCRVSDGIRQIPSTGWVGNCSAQNSTCTEYRDPEDPVDTTDPNATKYCVPQLPDGVTYVDANNVEQFACHAYYYQSTTVDQTSCNGLVNREEGCRLFNDTSKSTLTYDSREVKDGQTPEPCTDPTTCNANTVVKVIRDRVCGQWLDCSEYLPFTNKDNTKEQLCISRELCDKMDPQTGECVHPVRSDQVNQTYNTPAFVDQIKNKSGMVIAGLDWGRRCQNNENLTCVQDSDCDRCSNDATRTCVNNAQCQNGGTCQTGNTCSPDQSIIQGDFPVPAMAEVGETAYTGELITNGNFGDSDYTKNKILTTALTAVVEVVPPTTPTTYTNAGTDELPLGSMSTRWTSLGSADIAWSEENANNGQIPSVNFGLDENNVAIVRTTAQFDGIAYDLSGSLIPRDEYVVSFRLRPSGQPAANDRIQVQLALISATGNVVGYQNISSPFVPVLKQENQTQPNWEEYQFGPFTAGETGTNQFTNFSTARLQIIQAGTGTSLSFYLDDVSMKPLLRTNAELRCRGGNAEDEGKTCSTDADCTPGICYDYTKIVRSCRLYPSASSQYCNYTDETGSIYQGWMGYCLEKDPDNPKYCINWWPVDLLKGEANVLGTLPQVRYAGRSPLYMCVGAKGNYDRMTPNGLTSFSNGNYVITAANNFCQSSPASPLYNADPAISEYKYRQPMQTRFVRLLNANHDCGSQVSCGALGDQDFWGNSVASVCDNVVGGICACAEHNSLYSYYDLGAADQYYVAEVERLDFLYQTGADTDWGVNELENNNDGKVIVRLDNHNSWDATSCDPSSTHHNWKTGGASTCVSNTDNWFSVKLLTGTCTAGSIRLQNNVNGSAIGHTCGRDTDCGAGGACALTNHFTGMWMDLTDGSPGGGGMWVAPIFYLREACDRVVEVVDEEGDNKVWLSRLQPNSTYEVQPYLTGATPTDAILYRYTQDYAPYGGVIAPEGDPSIWDSREPPESGNQPLYIESPTSDANAWIRGGSPYRLNVGVGYGTMCIGGGDKQGHACTNSFPDCCDTGAINGSTCNTTLNPNNQGLCVGAQVPATGTGPRSLCTVGGVYSTGTCTTDAVTKLRSLFAGPVDELTGWVWDYANAQYSSSNAAQRQSAGVTTWQNYYVNMALCPYIAADRRVERPTDWQNEYCGVPPLVRNIAIGTGDVLDATKDTVKVQPGNKVQLSFEILADKDQKPIRRIQVDWGWTGTGNESGDILTLDGSYDSGTITLTKSYTNPNCSGYRPRIRVIDNWDWQGLREGVDPVTIGPNPSSILRATSNLPYWIDSGKIIKVGTNCP